MNNLQINNSRENFENRTGVYENAQFGRVITAMITPFNENGERVNYDAAQQLASYLEANGSDGLVVAGTTGESATLSHTEQLDLIAAVYEAVNIPILAGTGSNNTKEALILTDQVTERGIADGVLVVSPYYNRPPQSGIVDYFTSVAQATNLPVVMYNIPIRTGRGMSDDTIQQLAIQLPNIVGLKDATGEPKRTETLIKNLPEGFQVYSGDDSLNLRLFEAGAVGAISVISHWVGNLIQEMFDRIDDHDFLLAQSIDSQLINSYQFASSEKAPNPIPAKAMLRRLLRGQIDIGYCRPPMTVSMETESELESLSSFV